MWSFAQCKHWGLKTECMQLWCDLLQKLAIHTAEIRLVFPVWQQYFRGTTEGRGGKNLKLTSWAIFFKMHRMWNFPVPSHFHWERNNPGRTGAVQHNKVLELQGLYVCENHMCAPPLYLSVLILLWIMQFWQSLRTKVGMLQMINYRYAHRRSSELSHRQSCIPCSLEKTKKEAWMLCSYCHTLHLYLLNIYNFIVL